MFLFTKMLGWLVENRLTKKFQIQYYVKILGNLMIRNGVVIIECAGPLFCVVPDFSYLLGVQCQLIAIWLLKRKKPIRMLEKNGERWNKLSCILLYLEFITAGFEYALDCENDGLINYCKLMHSQNKCWVSQVLCEWNLFNWSFVVCLQESTGSSQKS